MSNDETDTTWVTPVRTSLNLETLVADENGAPPTDPGDGGDGSGDGSGDGNGNGNGSTDGEQSSSEGSSGRCQLGSYGSAASWACLALVVATWQARRRAR